MFHYLFDNSGNDKDYFYKPTKLNKLCYWLLIVFFWERYTEYKQLTILRKHNRNIEDQLHACNVKLGSVTRANEYLVSSKESK